MVLMLARGCECAFEGMWGMQSAGASGMLAEVARRSVNFGSRGTQSLGFWSGVHELRDAPIRGEAGDEM
jgi:hypothetical protein